VPLPDTLFRHPVTWAQGMKGGIGMNLNRWLLVVLAVAFAVLAVVAWNTWETAHQTLETQR